jgi:hypothetical protein
MASQYHGTVCKTCRRRGKKCDKLLPECSTCVEKGIKCEGYVFRWSGVASRGKLAGKTTPVADVKKGGKAGDSAKGKQLKQAGKKVETIGKARRNAPQPVPKEAAVIHEEEVEVIPEQTTTVWEPYIPPTATPQRLDRASSYEFELPLRPPSRGLELGLQPPNSRSQRWYDMPITDDDTEIDTKANIKVNTKMVVARRSPSPEALVYATIPGSINPFNAPSEVRFVLDYCKLVDRDLELCLTILQIPIKHPHD